MNNKYVKVENTIPGVTTLTLNRPDKRNALNREMMKELREAVQMTHRVPNQRVLIIRGEGKAFSSGLDLSETLEAKQGEYTGNLVASLLQTIYRSPLVTIAAVHGVAVAGGAGIAAACDIVVASEDAKIGFPEVRRGLVAAIVSTFLRRQLSERNIRELLLIAELVDAKRAYNMGLVNFVVPESELMNESLRLAEQVKKGAPAAIVETKRLLEDLQPKTIDEEIQKAIVVHKQSRMHFEAQEGMAAFLENREPRWDIKP